MAYDAFAGVYDRLMNDCDYSARADYLLGLFSRFGNKPKLMLDLCCGTGSLSVEMLRRGVDVIAADVSPEMLSVARDKAKSAGFDMLCLCQSADELDLFGTVDGAVCTLDSVNHIVEYDMLKAAFARVSLFLEPGCLFIFDVNSEFKHREVLGDNTFVIDDGDVYCVWRNCTELPYTDIALDFFTRAGETYYRSGEEFSERVYSDEELRNALKECGMETEGVFADMTSCAPGDECERIIYVARKV